MEIARIDPQTVLMSRLDPVLVELLRRIVVSADPSGSAAAQARLYSAPSEDADESAFIEDWREFVQPGLQHLFQSALEVISRDLKTLQNDPASGESTLAIPVSHLESWIHGLNQARLALSARHHFDEEENDRLLPMPSDPRSYALLQMRFYGVIEELFLHQLDE